MDLRRLRFGASHHPISRKVLLDVSTVLIFGAAIGLAVWQLWPRDESAWDRIRRTGEARVGYSLEAPFAFRDPQGRVLGEAPAVATEILTRLGVQRIEWVHAEFANLIPRLRTGRFDLVATGLFRTPERERDVAFSQPTVCVGHAFLVAAGNPLGLHDYPDFLSQARARLGVLAGAVEQDAARRAGLQSDRVLRFADLAEAVKAVQEGGVDALALSDASVRTAARTWPGVEVALPTRGESAAKDPLGGCAAVAFRLGDAALRTAFDRELDRYLGSEAHLNAIRPFGFDRGNLPKRPSGEAPSGSGGRGERG